MPNSFTKLLSLGVYIRRYNFETKKFHIINKSIINAEVSTPLKENIFPGKRGCKTSSGRPAKQTPQFASNQTSSS